MRDIKMGMGKGITSMTNETTELDAEFDLINELKAAFTDIEKATSKAETDNLAETFSYIRFLLHTLEDTLSGEFEPLRRQRFITKKSK